MPELKKGLDYTGVTVVFYCHDGNGRFVMSLRGKNARDEQGVWDPGGGSVDFGDTVEHTLRKEIMEEYCTDVLDFEFMGFRDVHRESDGKKTHWIALDFKVLVDPSMAKIGEPEKFDGIGWYNFQTLPPQDQLHSQLPIFLNKYQGRL